MKAKSKSEVAQLCLTLSDPMECSLPGSSVHGIFQARVLEWVALPSPKEFLELTSKASSIRGKADKSEFINIKQLFPVNNLVKKIKIKS